MISVSDLTLRCPRTSKPAIAELDFVVASGEVFWPARTGEPGSSAYLLAGLVYQLLLLALLVRRFDRVTHPSDSARRSRA